MSDSGRFDILAIGELNPDLILTGIASPAPRLGVEQEFAGHQLTLGSSTAISCVLMQRLGLRTKMAAMVGNDDHGRFCRGALTSEGVDTELIMAAPGVATGLTICLAYPDDRMLLTYKGAMALNPAALVGLDDLRQARHVHVGSFFLQSALRPALASLFAQARGLGLTTSLDTGWDPEERWLADDLRAVLRHTSYVFPNALEIERLSGERDVEHGIATLLDCGVDAVVAKLGAAGAVHGGADGMVSAAGFGVDAVDTTGAGDAFNAGYLHTMLNGEPVARRLAFGNACGALTVAAIGGTGGITGADQVDAFITAAGR